MAWLRLRFAARAADTPLHRLYQHIPPAPSSQFREARLLAVDCEMSGLNPAMDQLLSIGWTEIRQGRIPHACRRHYLIRTEANVGESAKIHGLTNTALAEAPKLSDVLIQLIETMASSVLVFHHASLDIAFLQKACLHCFGCPLRFGYLDTLVIERKRLQMQGKDRSLRLSACRYRYGLPSLCQHDALADAQATAELLLAQVAYFGGGDNLCLSQLGLRCAGTW